MPIKFFSQVTYQTTGPGINPVSSDIENAYIFGGSEPVVKTKETFHYQLWLPQPKKLLGLFKGLKIEEQDIEDAKKSLFPDREF